MNAKYRIQYIKYPINIDTTKFKMSHSPSRTAIAARNKIFYSILNMSFENRSVFFIHVNELKQIQRNNCKALATLI